MRDSNGMPKEGVSQGSGMVDHSINGDVSLRQGKGATTLTGIQDVHEKKTKKP